ncbi:MAG: GtrA family protein [Kofleriaceae bacterium]
MTALLPPARRRRLLGAAVGGVAATGFDVVVLTVLITTGAPVAAAAFVGALAGATVCFAINRRTLGGARTASLAMVVRFAAVSLASAVLMAGAMEVATARLALPYLTAKLVCAVVVFVCWSYPAQRRLVFVPHA